MSVKLQTLATFWQEFDLSGTQKHLDDLAVQITTRQDEGEASMKVLIDQSRAFKKENTEETKQSVAPLLKSFRNEIDALTKRSKAAEKAFFDIYQKFCDIGDPVPTLEFCIDAMKGLQKVTDLELEVGQLRETLTETNSEVTRLKFKEKELDQAQARLSELEVNMEASLEVKVNEAKEKLEAESAERLKEVEEERLMAEQRLAEAESKMKNSNKLLADTQAELDDIKGVQDRKRTAMSDEIEILLEDLDRANQRAVNAERELQSLEEKMRDSDTNKVLSSTSDDQFSQDTAAQLLAQKDLSLELASKEREIVQLLGELQKAGKSAQDWESKYSDAAENLGSKVSDLEEKNKALEARLEEQQDYEQVKKDLAILRSLEFSSEEKENQEKPLEVLILEKSKALQNENSLLRLEKERSAREIQSCKDEIDSLNGKYEKQCDLVTQLEDHVEQLQSISTPYREEAEGRSSSDMLAEVLCDTSTSEDVFVKEGTASFSGSSPTPGGQESSGALLNIMKSQRERFRQRNEELELQNEQHQAQMQLLQGEIQHLKQDNLNLYEKIRFLQSCGTSSRGSSDVHVPVETKYKSSYEQRLDPFSTFNQSERQRKYAQLSVFEKIILSLVRFMASNKTARLGVFCYAAFLHALVFAVVYSMALTDVCKQEVHGHLPEEPHG
eukprot:TRINITY_DN6586_c0_g1_i5.p1 TRINITY_DN6586_c0_g1~~TRINITY_DN6586_c0_g1_i5.p1  ORF type:complete len:670 (-),score=199.17 TRINITY_DN6586_c0_g1_i5:172-2181(-)